MHVRVLWVTLAILMASTPGKAEPRLSIHLKIVEARTFELTIRNSAATAFDSRVSSAFKLLPADASVDAVPNRVLWGPTNPNTGRPYDRAVRLGRDGAIPPPDPESRLLLDPQQSRTTGVDLDALKWQLAHLSVWPDRTLREIADPGEYILWFEVRAGEELLKSNEVRITLVAGGRPTGR